MYCTKCKSEIEESYLFCPECGQSVLNNTAEPNATVAQELNPRKKWPLWFKALLWAVIFGIFISGFVFIFTEDFEDTIASQITALHENKITEAYYGYTSRGFQNSITLERFRGFIKSNSIFTTSTKSQIKDYSFEDDTGNVTVLFEAGGDTIPVLYEMIREDGKWKISGLEIEAVKNTNHS